MKGMLQSIRALMRLKPAQKLTRDYLISLFLAVALALLAGMLLLLLKGPSEVGGKGEHFGIGEIGEIGDIAEIPEA